MRAGGAGLLCFHGRWVEVVASSSASNPAEGAWEWRDDTGLWNTPSLLNVSWPCFHQPCVRVRLFPFCEELLGLWPGCLGRSGYCGESRGSVMSRGPALLQGDLTDCSGGSDVCLLLYLQRYILFVAVVKGVFLTHWCLCVRKALTYLLVLCEAILLSFQF